MGRYREAIKFYDLSLGIDEMNSIGWLNRGVAYMAMKEYDQALASIDRALTLEPGNFHGIINRVSVLAAMGRHEEEADCLRGFLAKEPSNVEAKLMLGAALLKLARHAEALEQFDAVLARDPALFSAQVGRGHALSALNRADEAIESYKAATLLRDDVAELHAGYSIALGRAGRLPEALDAVDRALKLEPDSATYHSQRASLLQSMGRHSDASGNLQQASALSGASSDAMSHFQRGMDLLRDGESAAAQACFTRVLELDPKMTDAMLALCEISLESRNFPVAIGYALLALKTRETDQTRSYFLDRIIGQGHLAQNEDFRATLIKAMREAWQPPRQLFRAAAETLIRNGPIRPLIGEAGRQWPKPFDNRFAIGKTLQEVFKDDLLVCALELTQFDSVDLEKFLTLVRTYLLQTALDPAELAGMREEALAFTSALAQQCCINDYVFRFEPDEEAKLQQLVAETKGKPLDSTEAQFRAAVIAAYMPLNKAFRKQDFGSPARSKHFEKLVALQIEEPEALAEVRKEIPQLTAIEEDTSAALREQFEESPYPRWIVTPKIAEGKVTDRFDSLSPKPDTPKEILVAGCGTGQQLPAAARDSGSNVLAIDPSLSSLSYAKMKMDRIGRKNISYGHADILKLGETGRKFDVVFSTGGLHRMKDPEAGWRVLVSLLKPLGFMHIALYSELGRADLAKAREEITARRLSPTAGNIRRFRQDAGFSATPPLQGASTRSDFFTLNETRDLLFNAQEQRFTIPRIAKFLEENNLEFLGFDLPPMLHSKFQKDHPGSEATDLGAWDEFERKNPDTFSRMYVFWTRKKPTH